MEEKQNLIENCRQIFRTKRWQIRLNSLRILSILKPDRETVDFILGEFIEENDQIIGELMERLIFLDFEAFINKVHEIISRDFSKIRDIVEEEITNPRILNILFRKLNAYLIDQDSGDESASARIEIIENLIKEILNEKMIFHIILNLYENSDHAIPVYKKMINSFRKEQVVNEIEQYKQCGDPRFLMNSIIYLKENHENKRAFEYLEIFSKLEYGVDSQQALDKINDELKSKQRDPSKKLILILSDSKSLTNTISKSIECSILIENMSDPVEVLSKNKIEALSPDVIIIDKSTSNGKGIEVIKFIKKSKITSPVIVATDHITENEKQEFRKHGIKDYLHIPFTGEEVRNLIENIFERVEKETTIKKAKFSISAGEDLFHEGDTGDDCFIIQKGSVKIWRKDDTGKELHLITLGQGEIFGEMAIIDNSPRSASATAAEDTVLLRIAEENFENVLKSNPGFSLKMIKILVSRLRNVTDRLKKLEEGK